MLTFHDDFFLSNPRAVSIPKHYSEHIFVREHHMSPTMRCNTAIINGFGANVVARVTSGISML
jgi:hypothetical protein